MTVIFSSCRVGCRRQFFLHACPFVQPLGQRNRKSSCSTILALNNHFDASNNSGLFALLPDEVAPPMATTQGGCDIRASFCIQQLCVCWVCVWGGEYLNIFLFTPISTQQQLFVNVARQMACLWRLAKSNSFFQHVINLFSFQDLIVHLLPQIV